MGQTFSEITVNQHQFIEAQKIFFVATATADSRVNLSPKGLDSLRVLGKNRVIWLNVTGSGNETAAHVQEHPRMTIMFAAFEGKPKILRLYGKAGIIYKNDPTWAEYYSRFNPTPGARQIFDLEIDLVQTSCGMAVPYFDYIGERTQLTEWASKKGDDGIKDYWLSKNTVSLDGKAIQLRNQRKR